MHQGYLLARNWVIIKTEQYKTKKEADVQGNKDRIPNVKAYTYLWLWVMCFQLPLNMLAAVLQFKCIKITDFCIICYEKLWMFV